MQKEREEREMKDEAKKYFIYVVVLAVLIAGYYVFSGYISDNRTRDADIRKQFETLERNQQLLTTKLDGISKDLAQSQRRIETISSRIANAESGVAEVAGKLNDSQKSLAESAGLIEANQRLFQTVRKRTESQTSKP